MLPYRLVYDERYDLHLGEHVFPSKKYQWLRDRLRIIESWTTDRFHDALSDR